MNDMTIFNYNGKADVRTIIDEKGEPWFVGNDVCKPLGIINSRKTIAGLRKEDVTTSYILDARGCKQATTVISESGLYTLILRSRKPEAEPFQYWVTHEVLPSIRKTGTYTIPIPEGYPNFNVPAIGARAWVEALEQKEVAETKAQVAETKVIKMKPKADYFDAAMDSGDLYSVEVAAKMLMDELEKAGYTMFKLGRNTLFRVQ